VVEMSAVPGPVSESRVGMSAQIELFGSRVDEQGVACRTATKRRSKGLASPLRVNSPSPDACKKRGVPNGL
jgi:hypothetical protein